MKINLELFETSPFPLNYPIVDDCFRFESEGIATEHLFHGKRIKDITAKVVVDAFKETDVGALPSCMTDRAFVFFFLRLCKSVLTEKKIQMTRYTMIISLGISVPC